MHRGPEDPSGTIRRQRPGRPQEAGSAPGIGFASVPSVSNGLYSGVGAMRVAERRLEAIAANLANIETPAYKRDTTTVRAFRLPRGERDDTGLAAHRRTDFTQGELQPSSSPFHLALSGPGFFAVEAPAGELYTRNGTFHVDAAGVLQSAEGFPVAWASRSGTIDPIGPPVTIAADGTVRQGPGAIGSLRLVDFDDPGALARLGGGYFRADGALRETSSAAEVHQGALERSNASAVDELVAMIQVQRSFEGAARLMQMIDQSYRRLTQAG